MKADELLDWLWLAQAFPYGSIKPAELLTEYQHARAVYEHRSECAERFDFLTQSELAAMRKSPQEYLPILERCARFDIQVIPYDHPAYPARLQTIDCPPVVLYCRGSLAAFSESLCIAVVGTRTPSEYSKRVAAYAGRELAQRGICVLSGCSEGIDAEVHRAALSVGRTAAVLSCPLDKNYPASNEGLRREILRHGGALVSEFPPGTEFFPEQFALRNRLLSALSDGVVVVEASAKSGSLSTARAAADQGREVFCVPPADLFNPRYDGVKPLLREGAAQFLSVGDVTESFRYQFSVAATLPEEGTAHSPDLSELSSQEVELYRAMPDDPVDTGYLSAKTGLLVSDLMQMLTKLELSGAVRKTAGRYQKVY